MRQRASPGFTYIGLMVLIAVIGLVAAASLKLGTLFQRAAAEEELLEIGAQFSEALRSYAAATPQGQPQQPPSLQDLLKDPRFPGVRRHLRKIFVDPVTGKAEWGVLYLHDKVGVIGVYSLSPRRPLKIANFDIRFQNMDRRDHISDWKFVMAGGEGVNPALVTPNSMTGAAPGAVPASLFPPGAQVAKPAAGAPADPFAAAGKTGAGAPPGSEPAEPPAEPAAPGPAPDPAPAEDARPNVLQQPMETPPEPDGTQQNDAGDTKEPAADAAADASADASTPPPAPPAGEGQVRKR